MTGADTSRAWRELGAAALAHNVSVLRGALPPGCELMAVVKADAYGHGMAAVVPQLLSLGVRSFAAATLDEGSQLRALGAEGTVLILGCTSPQRAGELARLGLTQTVADLAHAEALNAQGVPLRVHLKIDTGMHRLGIAWDAPEAASAVFRMENLTVDGIYSHLCCADSLAPGDVSFTREQIRRFYALTAALAAQGISLPKLHLQSSYGLLNYPELRCDYARVGLALYGAAEGTAARSLVCVPFSRSGRASPPFGMWRRARASGMTARSLRVERAASPCCPSATPTAIPVRSPIPGSSVSTDVSRRSQDGYAWISSPWT